MPLTLSLFHHFALLQDGQPVHDFRATKAQALLAYLAIEANQAHPRAALATLLWPDAGETVANRNLRQAIYSLRQALGDSADDCLLLTRQSAQLRLGDPRCPLEVDVARFRAHVQRGELAAAADLYRGELLTGLAADSWAFDEWLTLAREGLHVMALDVLFRLTDRAHAAGDYATAKRYARRQLALEPWREEAHRQLMLALDANGERSQALLQYQQCCQVLRAEFDAEPSHETTALAARIRAVQERRLQAPPPADLSARTPRDRAPAANPAFVGRDAELAQVESQLADPDCRLLTVVGPGGMGKTSLVIEAAHRLRRGGRFPDGIVFVSLADVAAADAFWYAIADRLDVHLNDESAPADQICDLLRGRHLLLILDEFEHVSAYVDVVRQMLARTDTVKMLVTSRAALDLREEWNFPLAGLGYRRPQEDADPDRVARQDAVTLFAARARRVRPDFDLAQELPHVLRICQLVDGLPLSLELAATWARTLPCAVIAQELARSYELLNVSARDMPPRHRTLGAVFEESWQRLDPLEQAALCALTCFHQTFSAHAALAVSGASLAVLSGLVDKSLVRLLPSGRYLLHEMLRQFLEQKLAEDAAAAARVTARFIEYHSRLLAQQCDALNGMEQRAALQTLLPEIEHLRRAWRLAVTHRDVAAIDRAAPALQALYFVRSAFREGEAMFALAAAALTEAAAPDATAYPLRLRLQLTHAFFLNLLQRHDEAIALARRALDAAEAENDTALIVTAQLEWGNGLSLQGHHEQAIARLRLAAEQAATVRADALRARALFAMCRNLRLQGRHKEASAVLTEVLTLYQQLGMALHQAFVLQKLGSAAEYQELFELAVAYLEQALGLFRQVGDDARTRSTLLQLGHVYDAMGEYCHAQACFVQAAEDGEHNEDVRNLMTNQLFRATYLVHLGAYDAARQVVNETVQLARRIGHHSVVGETLCLRGTIECHHGAYVAALATFDEALAVSRASGAHLVEAPAHLGLGLARFRLERYDEAVLDLERARTHFRDSGRVVRALEAEALLARVALAQGHTQQALATVDRILAVLRRRPLHGVLDPAAVYLCCHRVLAAVADPRAAQVLVDGYQLLMTQAATIDDDAARARFLHHHVSNRALLALWDRPDAPVSPVVAPVGVAGRFDPPTITGPNPVGLTFH
ncbi:MAG: AAA family ATPase [Caldilineaceae bacterium]|nr:AAA family ATPase [Caldilineaceae bacterium]